MKSYVMGVLIAWAAIIRRRALPSWQYPRLSDSPCLWRLSIRHALHVHRDGPEPNFVAIQRTYNLTLLPRWKPDRWGFVSKPNDPQRPKTE